jgi:hypothetical protein
MRSIKRVAAVNVFHATATVTKAIFTVLLSEAFRGTIKFGSGLASIVFSDSSSHTENWSQGVSLGADFEWPRYSFTPVDR